MVETEMVEVESEKLPTATEEAKRYYNYLRYRVKGLQDLMLPPFPVRLTASAAFMDQHKDQQLFYDDVDSEDEDWVDISEESHEVPQEDEQEIARLAKEGGAMKQTAVKLQKKAIEAALEAAGVTGQQLVFFMKCVAEDSGWVSNCNTVDDLVKGLLSKYSWVKGAGAVLKELKSSFQHGRKTAGRDRATQLASLPVLGQVRKQRQQKQQQQQQPAPKASTIRREDFAGYEEVPLDETDLDCEPEILGRR
ncbi:hypothetical protein LTR36_000678 [Oleoguttula mirabilis]|uniref:Uncharacterized protein n=1 Tax=Oleoguttula mirabilis TaxID=1507867 RepID=A0AAV9JQE7_9PEZI|nr:hypothetical protein LTR36_000678 [Oleoguttula mirabilis]